jgi:hypothetical protein
VDLIIPPLLVGLILKNNEKSEPLDSSLRIQGGLQSRGTPVLEGSATGNRVESKLACG